MIRHLASGRLLGANVRSRATVLSVLAFTTTVASAQGADRSEPVPVRVELDAPPECPDADQFLAEILKRAPGARAASAAEAARRFRGSVRRSAGGFVGSVESESLARTDARVAQAASCGEVVSSLAMTVALSLDADTAMPIAPVTSSPPPAPAPPAPVSPLARNDHASSPAVVQPQRAPTLQWGFSLEAVLLVNTLPVSAGGQGSLMLRRAMPGAWSPALRLGAGFLRPAREAREVELRMPFLTVGLCPSRWDVGPFELSPCLRSVGGYLSGRALPPLEGNPASLPLLATGPELQLGLAASPLWFGVSAGALWVWSAPVFRAQPSGRALLEAERLAISAALGVGLVF